MFKLALAIELLLIEAGYSCDAFNGVNGEFYTKLSGRLIPMSATDLMEFLDDVMASIQNDTGFELMHNVLTGEDLSAPLRV